MFVCIAFLGHVLTAATFRIFAYISPTCTHGASCYSIHITCASASFAVDIAQTAPMSVIAILVLFAGFFVVPTKMGWSLPIYYVGMYTASLITLPCLQTTPCLKIVADVYAYATKALALNEFLADRYAVIPASGGDKSLGHIYLEDFGLPTNVLHLYLSLVFLIAYTLVLIILSIFAFSCVRFDRNIGSARTVDGDGDSVEDTRGHDAVIVSQCVAPVLDEKVPLFVKSSSTVGLAREPLLGAGGSAAHGLPFQRTTLAFQNVEYTVTLPRASRGPRERTLLQGICGYAEPGRMLALMGASGALR